MNSAFMSDVELDIAIEKAKKALEPIGYRSAREQQLRELHHGALVQVKKMRHAEAA